MNKNSNWLYADKELDNALTTEQLLKYRPKNGGRKVVYFYDGNNGDKHLVVGHTENSDRSIKEVLAINLSQCYLSGSYDSHLTANKLAEDLVQPKCGSEVVEMFSQVRVYSW